MARSHRRTQELCGDDVPALAASIERRIDHRSSGDPWTVEPLMPCEQGGLRRLRRTASPHMATLSFQGAGRRGAGEPVQAIMLFSLPEDLAPLGDERVAAICTSVGVANDPRWAALPSEFSGGGIGLEVADAESVGARELAITVFTMLRSIGAEPADGRWRIIEDIAHGDRWLRDA